MFVSGRGCARSQEKQVSNIIQFPQRAKPAKVEMPSAPTAPTEPTQEVATMLTSSAAMSVIAALAFYANNGWDEGKKARAAMPALQQLLATKGITLAMSPA